MLDDVQLLLYRIANSKQSEMESMLRQVYDLIYEIQYILCDHSGICQTPIADLLAIIHLYVFVSAGDI